MAKKHVTQKELFKERSKMMDELRDEARRLLAENAVLSGEVVTTDIDVENIESYRADRTYLVGRLGGPTYLGRALDSQRVDLSIYGDSKREQEEGRRWEESLYDPMEAGDAGPLVPRVKKGGAR